MGSWQWKGCTCFWWPEVLLCIVEAACCPFDTLATSSALPFMTWVMRQEQGMAGYCLGHQGPLTQDRRMSHGSFQEKAKNCILVLRDFLGGSWSDNEGLRAIYLIPGSKGWSFSFLNLHKRKSLLHVMFHFHWQLQLLQLLVAKTCVCCGWKAG